MLYWLTLLQAEFSGFNVFRYITFRSVGAAVTAFAVMYLCGPRFIALMRRLKFGQMVRDDGPASHLAKQGVPTMGGLLMLAAIFVSTILWARLNNTLVWLVLGVTVFYGLIGGIDDYRKISKSNSKGLSPRGKLLLQIAGAAVVAFYLFCHPQYSSQLSLPFFKNWHPDLGWCYLPFVVVVIIGASNAVNLTDGLDGLAVGPSMITAAVYLLFAYLAGNLVYAHYLDIPYIIDSGELAIFCAALFGSCLGFLWFNAYPAQIFMGDVGSLALGGAIGTIAIIVKQEFLLVIVGGVFVMEAVSVIMQVVYFKMTHGKRIFLMAPFHHHFEKQGWHEQKVVVRFWIISVVLGIIAIATLKLR
ncbi:MAG: phospho-N-acetylmuramoyl-pentapeptide-transferase [Desulfobulbaceae bacterium]|jgi:phospho-N-acetylmuramoyl-pentapeptide-transferase|nr:phospho-N-acetylmuramoyl-pentapeptide-transferase [Desulfobulbaceae bacterium]